MDTVATKTRENAEKFWTEWAEFLEDPDKPQSDPWSGPRSRAMTLGLLDVVQGPAESMEGKTKAIPWDRPKSRMKEDDDRRKWTDVAKLITRDEFLASYIDAFCPIITYACLDDKGWHAPGEMGWWGVDHSESGEKVKFQREFVKTFIKSAAADDLLVVVDCHI